MFLRKLTCLLVLSLIWIELSITVAAMIFPDLDEDPEPDTYNLHPDEFQESLQSRPKYKIETSSKILRRHIELLRTTKNQIIDIIFLVDSSASVGSKNFFDEIKFVRKLLAAFAVAENSTRVAVVTFSSRSRIVRQVDYISHPGHNRHKCMLLERDLKKISYHGGGTFTLGALRDAKRIFKNSRKASTKVVFLITDGHANGGDPRPEATRLKMRGVKLFTFGIRQGNVEQLMDIASHPKNETCYILDTFEEFEAMARRALHADLHDGCYISQKLNRCNRLCSQATRCCDALAGCVCGSYTGKYDCLCPAGYYGDGLRRSCTACPSGTFKPDAKLGDISSCLRCPDENHMTVPASTHIASCVCKPGYNTTRHSTCLALTCQPLSPPKYGYFVNKRCESVFNAVCGVRCRAGFRLRGSSLRMCKSDGRWTGHPVTCQVRSCPGLMAPKNGHMVCSRDDYSYKTVCRFTCNRGHRLVGSRKRACLAISYWTGITTRCKEITCRPLASFPDGTISPPTCIQSAVRFGTTCTVICRQGYTLTGPSVRQCMTSGYWTSTHDSQVTLCLDTTPPLIICSENITVDTNHSSDTAQVSWNFPVTIDNSGYIPSLFAIPSLLSPAKLPIGVTVLTYTATDPAQQNSTCSFFVTVRDSEPPRIDQCVSPPPIITPLPTINVTWDAPLFSDNSNRPFNVNQTHNEGEMFSKGKTAVVYTASDETGNTVSCTLWINVMDHKCEVPNEPENGKRTCIEGKRGMTCYIKCKRGYEFVESPPPKYWCDYKIGVWQPQTRVPFPDCALKQVSNILTQSATASFTSEVSCARRRIVKELEDLFQRRLVGQVEEMCEANAICSVDEFETVCRDGNVIPKELGNSRKRRSVPDRSILVYDFVIKSAMNVTGNETQDSLHQQELLTNHSHLVDSLQKMATGGDFDTTSSEIETHYTDDLPFQSGSPTLKCDEGSVLKDQLCVMCPVGMYHDVGKSVCVACRPGTYQPTSGQLTCIVCPPMTSTHSLRASNVSQCKARCSPGSFSNDGLEMCETCSKGMYQSKYAAVSCDTCPGNKTTLKRGHRYASDCKDLCVSGRVSRTGLEPCLPCPKGTYQGDRGQNLCHMCPKGVGTPHTGATEISQCLGEWDVQADSHNSQPVLFNRCFESVCKNNASCTPLPSDSFKCDCALGYAGVVCDTEINECEVQPCLNGASCQDNVAGFTCQCVAGFTGEKCERDIDECMKEPCGVNSTCEDLTNDYKCNCFPGFTGVKCDVELDECISAVCLNGGQCIDKVASFKCDCPRGFGGPICEVDIDECSSDPCLNNATCIDRPGSFRCDCAAGYSGVLCESETNDCTNSPCLNNGRCKSGNGGYRCLCLTAFSGQNCEKEMAGSYLMDFLSAGITDYSMVTLKPNLTYLSVALWMKTDDKDSNGTPLSYANSPSNTNALTITDYSGFVVYVNGENVITDVSVNDGRWHHVAFTWSSLRGSWKLYKDGQLVDRGRRLAMGTTVMGGGRVVLGQEQDAVGAGFSSSESFVGQLTHVNVWDEELTYSHIEKLRTKCEDMYGNVVAWPEFISQVKGKLKVRRSKYCQDCGLLDTPSNGAITYTGITPGSAARYRCDSGYDVVGRPRRKCLITSVWEFDGAKCELKQCGHPGNIVNGYITGRKYAYNEEIKYECYESYILKGPKTRYCTAEGLWDGRRPTCEKIRCILPMLSDHTNAIQKGESFLPGTIVSFNCSLEDHQLLTAHKQVLCQGDGTWDKSVPTCDSEACSKPPQVAKATTINAQSEYTVGSSVKYECNYGFVGAKLELFCLPRGVWEATEIVCKIITCPVPSPVQYSIVKGAKYTVFSVVEYTCNKGYKLQGRKVLECIEEGKWDSRPPKCVSISCPPLIVKKPLIAKALQVTYNSLLTYSCEKGYVLLGASNSTCLFNETWSGEVPKCVKISCGRPPNGNDRIEIGNKFDYNKVIKFRCRKGYFLRGASRRRCLITGLWQTPLPTCSRVSCGAPNIVNNSLKIGTSYLYEDTVEYRCNAGYEMNGSAILQCKADKTWSTTDRVCELVSCDPIKRFFFGSVLYTNYLFGSTVKYSCNEGFELRSGNEVRRCQSDKKWSGNTPICVIIVCPSPQNLEHGINVVPSLPTIGSISNHTCAGGYKLVGSRSRHCLRTLVWSGTQPQCERVICKVVPDIDNGYAVVEGRYYFVGVPIEYLCENGYKLKGNHSGVCSSDGQWSGGGVCELIQCNKPSLVISNGRMIDSVFTYGSVVRYVCDEGYGLGGVSSRRCTNKGIWDAPIPVCEKVSCGAPARIANGRYEGFLFTYQATVKIRCNKGYTLVGDQKRTCQSDKTWLASEAQCVLVKCDTLGDIENGIVAVDSTGFRGRAVYSCNVGHYMVGAEMGVCQMNSTWDKVPPSCQPILCPPLSSLLNGVIHIESRFYESPMVFSCDDGYQLVGSSNATCLANGEWSSDVPSCVVMKCKDLSKTIADGTVHYHKDSTAVDALIKYGCHFGFKLVGVDRVQCLASGEWSASPPSCEVIMCGKPNVSENVITTGDIYRVNSTLRYSCESGYDLIGQRSSLCMISGEWSENVPRCIKLACPGLKAPINGEVKIPTGGIGAVATYKCNVGYAMLGESESVCKSDLTWAPEAPACAIVMCEIPIPIKYGRIDGLSYEFGAQLHYICNKGYELIGEKFRVCDSRGQWSSDRPSCVRLLCSKPVFPANGRVLENDFSFLSLITYICNQGYELVGNAIMVCLETKKWSGTAPQCRRIKCPVVDIPFGSVVGEITLNSIVRYHCNEGYALLGNEERTCQDSKSWSGDAPTCSQIICPLIRPQDSYTNTVNHTLFILPSKPSYLFGDSVQYYCSRGYTLIGTKTSTCQLNGTWSGGIPDCQKVTCNRKVIGSNMNALYSDTKFGENAYFSCKLGYALRGDAILTCTESGKWSAPYPSCYVVKCSPPKLENASFKGNDFTPGKYVEIVCHTGYKLVGESTVRCMNKGKWDFEASCTALTCSVPRVVDGTIRDMKIVYSYDDEIEVTCVEGFALSSSGKLICRENEWIPSPPKCLRVKCSRPPEIPNARLVRISRYAKAQFIYGDKYRYTCVYGYEHGNRGMLQCGSNGTWEGKAQQCNPILCGNPPTVPNSNIISVTYTLGGLARYACTHGYDTHEQSFAECNVNKTWVFAENFICHLVDCKQPPSVANAQVTAESTTYGSVASYSCDQTYVMVGYNSLVCDANKDWVGELPQCVRVTCPQLITSLGVELSHRKDVWYVGDRVRFSCKPGLTLVNVEAEVSECGADSKWTVPVPRCQVQHCTERSFAANMEVLEAAITVGMTVTLLCKRGFIARGDMTARCHKDASWSRVSGTCHRLKCGRRVHGSNVILMGRSFMYGDRALYKCRPGFLPAKVPSVITCSSSGRWVPYPRCRAQCKGGCLNGGMCIGFNRCKCRNGFGGARCHIPVCILPCLNGGSCTSPYSCSCTPGFDGSRCQRVRCDPACVNRGRCVSHNRCVCPPGLSGPRCHGPKPVTVAARDTTSDDGKNKQPSTESKILDVTTSTVGSSTKTNRQHVSSKRESIFWVTLPPDISH